MKKLCSSVLAMILVVSMLCSFGITAFADDYLIEGSAVIEETQQSAAQSKLYTWTHPVTGKVYTDLSYEQYQQLLASWAAEKAAKPAVTEAPAEETAVPTEAPTEETVVPTEAPTEETVVPTEAPVEETAVPTEAPAEETAVPTEAPAKEPVPTETPVPTEAPVPEKELKEDYFVDFIVGDTKLEVGGSEGIAVNELAAALGIEIPEGAEVTIDPSSIDTANLTVTLVDGKQVITTNGPFYEADRDLVILVNGVPTSVKVVDDVSAAALSNKSSTLTSDINIAEDSADGVVGNQSGVIKFDNTNTPGNTATIDLNGHTIYGAEDEEYAIIIDGTGAAATTPLTVTFTNGTIDAAKNAVKVMGNAIVNFWNMTVKAAKEVLHLDSTSNTGSEKTEANEYSNSVFVTTNELGNTGSNDTVVVEGDSAKAYINGVVANFGSGYALDVAESTGNNSVFVLDEKAEIVSAKKTQDISPDVKAKNVFSRGASFADDTNLNSVSALVLDLNYDTLFRYQTIDYTTSLPANPTRSGYTFVAWNTAPDGTGWNVTRDYALKNGVTRLYAIWTPVNVVSDYAWVVRGTVLNSSKKDYIASTRISIENRVAKIYFQNGTSSAALSPVKVEFLDVKYLRNLGADTIRVQLDKNLYLELDMDDLIEKGDKAASNVKTNTFLLTRDDDDLLTVTSGKTDIFCFNADDFSRASKNDVTVNYKNSTVTVYYAKDAVCDTKLPDGQFSSVALNISAKSLSVSKATATK